MLRLVVQAMQLRESSPPSTHANVPLHQKPIAAVPSTVLPSQQPNVSSGHAEHYTQTDAAEDEAASCRLRSKLQQGMAAQLHAGHAELLRFKRHWPLSRPLLLSDSDDSDSLSEFDSLADFRVEPAAHDCKLMSQDGSTAVQSAGDESHEGALQIRTPEDSSSTAKGSRPVAAGQLCQCSAHTSKLCIRVPCVCDCVSTLFP